MYYFPIYCRAFSFLEMSQIGQSFCGSFQTNSLVIYFVFFFNRKLDLQVFNNILQKR